MAMNRFWCVLLSLVMLLEFLTPGIDARRLDCTKFVFAPRCRGVSAKRSQDNLMDHEKSTLASETLTLDRFSRRPEDLEQLALDRNLIMDPEMSSKIQSKLSQQFQPRDTVIDLKMISPSSIRDLVDMYRIRWRRTQQTGLPDKDNIWPQRHKSLKTKPSSHGTSDISANNQNAILEALLKEIEQEQDGTTDDAMQSVDEI